MRHLILASVKLVWVRSLSFEGAQQKTRPIFCVRSSWRPLKADYPAVLGGLRFGLSGPADLPQDVVSRLNSDLAALGKDEGFATKLQSTGVTRDALAT
jgi:hypothetical protein